MTRMGEVILTNQEAFRLVHLLLDLIDVVGDAEAAGFETRDSALVPEAWEAAQMLANRATGTEGGDA
jgi:hypothetical protein